MSSTSSAIVSDVNSKPTPQYYNPTSDAYEVLKGASGASRVLLYDADGNAILTADNPGVVQIGDGTTASQKLSVDDDGAASVKLTGRSVVESTPINAVAITTTTAQRVSVDVSAYKKIYLVAYSSLDQDVEISARLNSSGNATFSWDGTAWGLEKAILDSGSAGVRHAINSKLTWLNDAVLGSGDTLTVQAFCSVAPTSGSVTVLLMGVPN